MSISYDRQVEELIRTFSRKYHVDEEAALAVASVEGGVRWGAVGDGGTSFGPFQLHEGGVLPPGKNAAWANSPAGIEYAIRKMAEDGAKGKKGKAAVEAIVRGFERPKYPGPEVQRAWGNYGKIGSASHVPGSPVSVGGLAPVRPGHNGTTGGASGSGGLIKLDPPGMHEVAVLMETWRGNYTELEPRLDGGHRPAMAAHVAAVVSDTLADSRKVLAEVAAAWDADGKDLNRRAQLADPSTPGLSGHRGTVFRFFDKNPNAHLGEGSKDKDVVRGLQRRLIMAGYGPLPADGIFGPATKAALLRFQKENGIHADGVLNKHTWYALVKADRLPHVSPQSGGANAGGGATPAAIAKLTHAQLVRAVIDNPNFHITGSRANVLGDIESGRIHDDVLRGMLVIMNEGHFRLDVYVMETGHGNDGPHGHAGGWAVDISNYTSGNYAETTHIMKWLNEHRSDVGFRQLIGANESLVYPHYYDQSTLNAHKNHLHIGWGPWP